MALAGVAQWIECRPEKQKVAGLIPGQGPRLVCRPGPQLSVCERQPIDVSLAHRCVLSFSFSLPYPLSENK